MKRLLLTLMFINFFSMNAQTAIQEFNFDGTLHNTQNTTTFMGTATYVNDRMGTPKKALRLANSSVEAIIDNLPQSNDIRTVSIWVKFNDVTVANYIWGYGSAYNSQYYGLLQQSASASNSDLNLAGWGPSNDIIVRTTIAKNTWYNYTTTYDGVTSKIYRDGELIKTINGTVRNTKGTIFKLGKMNTIVGINSDIDDLKIFGSTLSDDEVADLYNSSKPKVALVVETVIPVKKGVKGKTAVVTATKTQVSNITATTLNLTPKTVEVFSKGEKILGSNQQEINVNDLPEGTYLLKVTNLPTKKLSSN